MNNNITFEHEYLLCQLRHLPLGVYQKIDQITGEGILTIIGSLDHDNNNFKLEVTRSSNCGITVYELKIDSLVLIRTTSISDICDIIGENFEKFSKFDFDIDVFNYIPHIIETRNLDIEFTKFDRAEIKCVFNDNEYTFHYDIKTNGTDKSYSVDVYNDIFNYDIKTNDTNKLYSVRIYNDTFYSNQTYYSSFNMYNAIIDNIYDYIKNRADKETRQPEPSNRINKDEYYINIAKTVLQRSTCLRRKFGAVIVKTDRIISTGYNGAPAGRVNCCDIGTCFRQENNIQPGQRYELCRSIHAEQNAILYAGYDKCKDATLYLIGFEVTKNDYMESCDCCAMCKRIIIQSGIKTVVFGSSSGEIKTIDVSEWIENDDSLIIHEGY